MDRNLIQVRSIWLKSMLIICNVLALKESDSTNTANINNMQEKELPAINPSTEDIISYLKNLNRVVFVKNFQESKKNGFSKLKFYIDSLLVHEDNIYSAKPVVSVSYCSWLDTALKYIGFYKNFMKNTSTSNIMLNYRKTDEEYERPFIYKNAWVYSYFRRIEKKIRSSSTILNQLAYYLYVKEIYIAKNDFNLAKENFIEELEAVGLSMNDLRKRLNARLIRAIENKKPREDINELYKTMAYRVTVLSKIFSYIPNVFEDEIPSQIQRNPHLYNRYFYSAAKKFTRNNPNINWREFYSANITFTTLKNVFMGYNPWQVIEKFRNNPKTIHRKWENPVFVTSIMYHGDLHLAIEFKVEVKGDKDKKEIENKFQIVEFTEKNIRAIQEAQTIKDIIKIDSINTVSFSTDMIITNLLYGMGVVKKLSSFLCPNYKLDKELFSRLTTQQDK